MLHEQFSLATTILYVGVICLAVMIAFFSYKKGVLLDTPNGTTRDSEPRISKIGLCFTFIVLWVLLAFSKCGADYSTYNMLFENALNWDYCVEYHDIEPLFALLNLVIRLLTHNVNVYNGIIAFIYLFIVFKALYAMKNMINFGWGIMAFTCCFYLQFMNLKRIGLASAIVFFAMQYLVSKRYRKYVICIAVATLIHTSALILLIPMLIELFAGKKMKNWHMIVSGFIMLALIYAFRDRIVQIVISERYINYGLQESKVGIAQIVLHLPFLWILAKKKDGTDETRVSLIMIICSFAVGMMGYFVSMIGRTSIYFLLPFTYTSSLSNTYEKGIRRFGRIVINKNTTMKALFVIYYVVRIYIYFSGSIYSDKLMPYIDIYGNVY